MTPEQILEKHLLIMLGRTVESYVSIEEMKKQPEWQTTINAMLEYAEHRALSQHDVIETDCGCDGTCHDKMTGEYKWCLRHSRL